MLEVLPGGSGAKADKGLRSKQPHIDQWDDMGLSEKMEILGIAQQGGAAGASKGKSRSRKRRKRRGPREIAPAVSSASSVGNTDLDRKSGAATAVSSTDLISPGIPLSLRGPSFRGRSGRAITSVSSDIGASSTGAEHIVPLRARLGLSSGLQAAGTALKEGEPVTGLLS